MRATNTEIQDAILAYLQSRPNAEDTLDGVVQWWVLESWIDLQRTEVQAALDELVDRGWVVRKQRPGTGVRYRLNSCGEDGP